MSLTLGLIILVEDLLCVITDSLLEEPLIEHWMGEREDGVAFLQPENINLPIFSGAEQSSGTRELFSGLTITKEQSHGFDSPQETKPVNFKEEEKEKHWGQLKEISVMQNSLLSGRTARRTKRANMLEIGGNIKVTLDFQFLSMLFEKVLQMINAG